MCCLFIGTFVEAIDRQIGLCYTIIVIDFCAPSDWDSWSYSAFRRFAALHTLLSLYAGSGISMPTTLLFHVIWIMDQDFPVGLMCPPNGRSKCMERLDAPIGCVQAFLHCRRLQRRNREKSSERLLVVLGLTSTIHTDSVVGRMEFWLHVWSDCRRPFPVPVCKLPVRPQGSTSFYDLSRSGQRTHAILYRSWVQQPCPPRSPRQEFISHAAFVLTMTISQKRQTS